MTGQGKNSKTSGTPASIREALKKAATEMLLLYVLQEKPMYTYEIMQAIERMSEGQITFNTLYQAIYRLQGFQYIREEEKVLSERNRVRIYFGITEEGRVYLDQLISEYRAFTGAVDRILTLETLGKEADCS